MTRTNSQPEGSGLRAGLLLAAMLGALVYLAACLYQIQVRDSHLYIGAQNQTSIRRVRLPATRGRILDRNGLILADNRPRYCAAFYLDELRAPGRWSNTVARVSRQMDAVAAILDRPREIEDAGIWSHLYRRRPIPLIAFRDLDEVALARLAEWPQPLAGVDLFVQQDRVYPYGDLACHIIGYVGKGNPTEKPAPRPATPEETDNFGDAGTDADFDFYLPDLTGREGIEKSFDAELAGRGGGALLRIDAIGYKRETLEARAPMPGRDVVLTLDVAVQQAAERALEGHRGAAVVLDARNGDILALASAPRYDLSTFVPTLSGEVWRTLLNDPERPLINRAAAGVYPPGSVVKPVVALEALTGGFIGEFETVHCNGAYRIGNHRIRCASRWGHGDVAVRRALAASCNPYFMDVALRMGYEPRLYEAYRKLGFGTAPVIGIPTRSGLLPSDAWKRRRQHDAWRAGDTAYASIGQGFLSATPLQIARYMLTIANQGEILETRLVRDPGTGIPDTARRVVGRMDWSPAALRAVLEGMTDVVASPHGTGRRAAIPGLTIAGKTGTAEYREKGELRKHAWMIAQVPAENPEAVFAVICENADSGGHAAAAVLRSLLIQMYRPNLGHAPATPLPPAAEGANAPVPAAENAEAAAETGEATAPERADGTDEADDVTAEPETGAEDAPTGIAPPAPVLELEPTEVAP